MKYIKYDDKEFKIVNLKEFKLLKYGWTNDNKKEATHKGYSLYSFYSIVPDLYHGGIRIIWKYIAINKESKGE